MGHGVLCVTVKGVGEEFPTLVLFPLCYKVYIYELKDRHGVCIMDCGKWVYLSMALQRVSLLPGMLVLLVAALSLLLVEGRSRIGGRARAWAFWS